MFLVFRWLTGFAGAAFLSVAGGSVSDMFQDHHVAKLVRLNIERGINLDNSRSSPMAVYTISPFIGPVVGPLISGYVFCSRAVSIGTNSPFQVYQSSMYTTGQRHLRHTHILVER